MPDTANLSVGWLIAIAAIAIAILLFLIIWVRLHAILALIVVSAGTAVATGTSAEDIVDTLTDGLGGTLGTVALLIGFGAMLGRLIEVSGGARVLSDGLIRLFGEKRAPLALSVASLLFGFPIFLDAAFVVMVPIIFSVARRLGGSLLLYALPATGAFVMMHALLPPHPGPVAAADAIGAHMGIVVVVALLVGLPTWWFTGYLLGKWMGQRVDIPVPDILGGGSPQDDEDHLGPPPPLPLLIMLLVLPVALIFMETGLATLSTAGVVDGDATWVHVLQAIGKTPSALLITVLVALWLLGWRRRHDGKVLERVIDRALAPVCSIILLTGAGGMFGAVLQQSGIGDAVADSLDAMGLPLIVAAFLVAASIRVAQGSATVAATTAGGLIAPAIHATGGFSQFELSLLVLAVAAGSIVLSHVNDSGFWLVRGFLGMDTKTTLKTWTLQGTAVGLMTFAIVTVLFLVV
ncbi:GntP family permease [Spiractinospora alimapuensis]|uniref:GntP family permease n=1 Tax=Spiractinospora alimapuensis TaxID=2820884 RepID=UPI001F35C096|nr:GntP family permease [Spiractinospora alimapuensis]QVQ50815.1 GntP family permease [Spiractinospora alimapuensis]